VITIKVPHLTPGTVNWVVVHTLDGSSPCEGDAQMLTVDDITEVPPGPLEVTGVVPDTIAMGRREPYWITGTGLSQVRSISLGGTFLHVEAYDDTQMMFWVPDEIEGATDGATLELEVSNGDTSATRSMTCTAPVEPRAEEDGWPVVQSVEPASLPASGGTVTVRGLRLWGVNTVTLGTVGCTVEDFDADWVRAMAPSLAQHIGAQLPVAVATSEWASPEANGVFVTVEG
jgi:hypothetical protein